jgi:orotidine-5'-phosphate decarboxylase
MKPLSPEDRIIFALDFPNLKEGEPYIKLLKDHVGMFKIGLQLFVSEGPKVIDAVLSLSSQTKVFLDMKFHDIPETVKGAIKSANLHGVEFVTVHCDEGRGLLRTAVESAGGVKMLGVTVLTSLSKDDLADIGIAPELRDPSRLVLHRARIAKAAGCNGVVCSGEEVRAVKEEFGDSLVTVTPGIRLAGETIKNDDQKRIVTPYKAVYDGADYIVVGRPIKMAADPVKAANDIAREIERAVRDRGRR